MKAILYPLLVIIFFFFQSSVLFSQNQTDISKIIIGKNYKLVLFDDTEILGKVTGWDSSSVKVETSNKSTIIIPRGNIFYYTTELAPTKYNFSLSLLAGVSFVTSDMFPDRGNSSGKSGPNFNLSGTLFLSDTKAIKFDAGYTYVKANYNNYYTYYSSNYRSIYEGGNVSLFSFKANILFGRFYPDERFMLSFGLGFGFNIMNQQEVTDHSYQQQWPDTTWVEHIYTNPAKSEISALVSLGGSLDYRLTKRLGVKIEMEYYMVTAESIFLIFGNRNYLPMRAGLFYIF
jgi:hypothetical protein